MGEAFACHRHVLFEIGFSKSAKNEAGRKPSSLCKPHGSKLIYIPVYTWIMVNSYCRPRFRNRALRFLG